MRSGEPTGYSSPERVPRRVDRDRNAERSPATHEYSLLNLAKVMQGGCVKDIEPLAAGPRAPRAARMTYVAGGIAGIAAGLWWLEVDSRWPQA